MSTQVLATLIALFSAVFLALVNAGITARAGVDEELRRERLAAYLVLWSDTQAVARWPRAQLTRAALTALQSRLCAWYYDTGGLFLSNRSQARYQEVQGLIAAALLPAVTGGPEDVLDDAPYTELMEACSAMRTALTQDLDTRRRKSLLARWQRLQVHREAERKAGKRLADAEARTGAFRLSGATVPGRSRDG